jgi:hypothetical protein
MNERIFALALGVLVAFANTSAFAQEVSSWDGVWAGAWHGHERTSVQISHGRVVRYEFQVSSVPIATQKVSAQSVTFGVPGRYTVTMDLTGPGRATATYNSSINGSATADLTKQTAAELTKQYADDLSAAQIRAAISGKTCRTGSGNEIHFGARYVVHDHDNGPTYFGIWSIGDGYIRVDFTSAEGASASWRPLVKTFMISRKGGSLYIDDSLLTCP